MAWVAKDYIGEWIFNCKPDMWAGDCIEHNYWLPQDRHGAYGFQLPKGSIKKLIGRELSWSDEPVKLKEEQLMYRPITMYQIVCDRCGEVFGGTDTCSALFHDKSTDIEDFSNWKMIDGKHYCPVCNGVRSLIECIHLKKKQL